MSRYRNVFMRSVPALVGLCIVFFLGSILKTSQYHTDLIKYGKPICQVDRHRFEGDTCEACGNDVSKSGVFFSSQVAMEKPYGEEYQLAFKDYYENWDSFEADYNMCMSYSKAIFGVVIFEVCMYGFMWVKSKHESKGGARLK